LTLPDGVSAWDLYSSEQAVEWGKEWASYVQPGQVGNVRKITDHHVVKLCNYPRHEVQALQLVSTHTSIPVPCTYLEDKGLLIMNLIPGLPLARSWDRLGLFTQFRVCCTVRMYIRQLQNMPKVGKPGPLSGPIRGALFESEEIPHVFPTWVNFQAWCETVARMGWNRHLKVQAPNLPKLSLSPPFSGTPDFSRLVFTHGDLHPSNLILDPKGHLWVIDWEDSGYYPVWFESLGMVRYERDMPRSWNRWYWFMVGKYPDAEFFWYCLRGAISIRL
jgi:hypothetical protein